MNLVILGDCGRTSGTSSSDAGDEVGGSALCSGAKMSRSPRLPGQDKRFPGANLLMCPGCGWVRLGVEVSPVVGGGHP